MTSVESDEPAFGRQIDDRTKALNVEAIGNPRFNVPDFRGWRRSR